jgi:hypothetical protein
MSGWALIACLGLATAQQPPDGTWTLDPGPWRTGVGSVHGLAIDDTVSGGPFVASVQAGWALATREAGPLRSRWSLTPTVAAVVGPVRVGLVLPVLAVDDPDLAGAVWFPGDPAVDVRVVGREVGDRRPGVAVTARVTAPAGASRWAAGMPAATAEVAVVGDLRWGPAWWALQVGWRVLPELRVGEVWLDDALVLRGAVAVRIRRGGLAVEAVGQVRVVAAGDELATRFAGSAPVELVASGWGSALAGGYARVGVGVGLGEGLGSATARVVVSVGMHSGVER